jgi:hypothetical protein
MEHDKSSWRPTNSGNNRGRVGRFYQEEINMKKAEYSSTFTRRESLRLTGVGVSTLALSSCGLWQTGQQGLATPLPRATRTDRVQEYLLDVGRLDLAIGEQSVSTWVYNGAVPGPELRLTEGDRLRVAVRNHLPEETTTFKGRYFGERREERKQRDRLICSDGKKH